MAWNQEGSTLKICGFPQLKPMGFLTKNDQVSWGVKWGKSPTILGNTQEVFVGFFHVFVMGFGTSKASCCSASCKVRPSLIARLKGLVGDRWPWKTDTVSSRFFNGGNYGVSPIQKLTFRFWVAFSFWWVIGVVFFTVQFSFNSTQLRRLNLNFLGNSGSCTNDFGARSNDASPQLMGPIHNFEAQSHDT